jgi:hypothetical protein
LKNFAAFSNPQFATVDRQNLSRPHGPLTQTTQLSARPNPAQFRAAATTPAGANFADASPCSSRCPQLPRTLRCRRCC